MKRGIFFILGFIRSGRIRLGCGRQGEFRLAVRDRICREQEGDGALGIAYIILSSLVFKSDFTNRMCVGVSSRPGRIHGGIRAAWLLKSPSMAILP